MMVLDCLVKVVLAGFGLTLGMIGGFFIAIATGLMQFSC
jgi:hypothetical protein